MRGLHRSWHTSALPLLALRVALRRGKLCPAGRALQVEAGSWNCTLRNGVSVVNNVWLLKFSKGGRHPRWPLCRDGRPNPKELMGWAAVALFGLVDGAAFQVRCAALRCAALWCAVLHGAVQCVQLPLPARHAFAPVGGATRQAFARSRELPACRGRPSCAMATAASPACGVPAAAIHPKHSQCSRHAFCCRALSAKVQLTASGPAHSHHCFPTARPPFPPALLARPSCPPAGLPSPGPPAHLGRAGQCHHRLAGRPFLSPSPPPPSLL